MTRLLLIAAPRDDASRTLLHGSNQVAEPSESNRVQQGYEPRRESNLPAASLIITLSLAFASGICGCGTPETNGAVPQRYIGRILNAGSVWEIEVDGEKYIVVNGTGVCPKTKPAEVQP